MKERGHIVKVAAGGGTDGDKFDVTVVRDRVETKITVSEVRVNGLPFEAGVLATFGDEEQDRNAIEVDHEMHKQTSVANIDV